MKIEKEIPYFCTRIDRGVAQLASVLAWGASGRQFESDHSDKIKSKISVNLYFTEIFYYQQKIW